MSATHIRSYRDLRAWQSGLRLSVEVYRLTRLFPADEKFGLTPQLRRAAVSVISNIAEGHERRSARAANGEFRHFVSIARGSVAEIEAQVTLAEELGYLSPERLAPVKRLAYETSRLLVALHRSLST